MTRKYTKTPPANPTDPVDIDHSVGEFASRHKLAAVACLVQIIEDPEASPRDKAIASTKILEYAEGRPAMRRAPDINDVASLPDETLVALLDATVKEIDRRRPGTLSGILQAWSEDHAPVDTLDEADYEPDDPETDLRRDPEPIAARPKFVRGERPTVPRSVAIVDGAPPDLPTTGGQADPSTSGSQSVPGPVWGDPVTDPLSRKRPRPAPPAPVEPPAPTVDPGPRRYRYDAAAAPDPVAITEPQQLEGFDERPPPCGLRFGTAADLERNNLGHTRRDVPAGWIDPSVVTRSAQIGSPLGVDYALRPLLTQWRWPR